MGAALEAKDPLLARMREICLGLPGSKETSTWGHPNFRVGDKVTPQTVMTTVDSQHHSNIVTTDYGNKVLVKKTDEVKGMPWLEVGTQGAEYGFLKWKDGDKAPKLGDRVEIYCTNLDQSTNAFDRYYITQGDRVVDVWPIMGRSGAAQR